MKPSFSNKELLLSQYNNTNKLFKLFEKGVVDSFPNKLKNYKEKYISSKTKDSDSYMPISKLKYPFLLENNLKNYETITKSQYNTLQVDSHVR